MSLFYVGCPGSPVRELRLSDLLHVSLLQDGTEVVQWHWRSLWSSEDTSFSQESVGLQEQTLHVHTESVKKRYKVLCAEHCVC